MKMLILALTGLCLLVGASVIGRASPPGDASKAAGGASPIPLNLLNDAREAKSAFDHGLFLDSQKIYEKMLNEAPDNVYILSNLGVVYFRNQQLKLAEDSLKKAISVAPQDAFSHFTLGVVYYTEKRNQDAANSFARALAINPNYRDAQGYMYLVRHGSGPIAPQPTLGDFETEHERLIRQGPKPLAPL